MEFWTKKMIIVTPHFLAGSAFGVRHVQYVLMFSATILAYGTRTVLNVAVVAMVSNKTSEYYPVSSNNAFYQKMLFRFS